MTISEKILSAHSGDRQVKPGDLIDVDLDLVLANDVSAPLSIEKIRALRLDAVFDAGKVCLVLDHFAPNATVKAAQQCKYVRDFAREYDIEHFYDVGCMGIEHALLPEKGLVSPGQVVVGGDSHTCTYGALGAFATGMGSTDITAAMATGVLWMKVPESVKFVFTGALPRFVTGKDLILAAIGRVGVDGALYKAMEFTGDTIAALSMDGRFTMCNMAIEAGAKNGIIAPDTITAAYLDSLERPPASPPRLFSSNADAAYADTHLFDVSDMRPQVAFPHLPSNVHDVDEGRDIRVDQVVIGSCTNGRLEDLRAAAEVLRGNRVARGVRVIVIPATQRIYRQAVREGLIDIFLAAGAAVSTPTCGPCFGGHMGILASGERAVSTTNRNFVGRMGAKDSEVYLASPYVAAATAVTGVVSHPGEVL